MMRRAIRAGAAISLALILVQAAPAAGEEGTAAGAVGPPEAGARFTMEFRDADLRDVLRLLAQESGLNIILGEEVTGKVTVSFREVSLGEALDAILESHGYHYSVSGDIVVVSAAEPEAEIVTRAIPVRYSGGGTGDGTDIANLAAGLEPLLSGLPGAHISVVDRTGTLVVSDTPERVERIAALVKDLDQRIPQVKIEARIVEVKDMHERELGIQWQAAYAADPAHGNATPYEFPNSIGVKGTEGGGNYLVNLPAAAPVAGVGISLGHIANTLSLDLRLSAMEKMNRLKILSSPSVLALQNRKAVISVGEEIPFIETSQTTSSTGDVQEDRQVEFIEIPLRLTVTPSVIPGGTVHLDVSLSKKNRGEKIVLGQGEQSFSIDTKEVTTSVMLRDGETAVIGGLFTQEKHSLTAEVPGLARIPILGWLFRSRSSSNVRNELLVFLTPRIQMP